MSSKAKAKALADDIDDGEVASMLELATSTPADPGQWLRDKNGDLDWAYTAHSMRSWSPDALLSHLWAKSFSIPPREYNPSAPFVWVKLASGDTVTLPHGYRLPLMFVAKYRWETTLMKIADEREWKIVKSNMFHLSRLCENLFRRAQAKAARGGMEKGWRCIMFDRLLARFYKHWDRNDPQGIKGFITTHSIKEYDRDVLKHDWKRWCLRGLNGVKMTDDEVTEGITIVEFRKNMARSDDGVWTLGNITLPHITAVVEEDYYSSLSELTDEDMENDDSSEEDDDEADDDAEGVMADDGMETFFPEPNNSTANIYASSPTKAEAKRPREFPIDHDELERSLKRSCIEREIVAGIATRSTVVSPSITSTNTSRDWSNYKHAQEYPLTRTLAAMARHPVWKNSHPQPSIQPTPESLRGQDQENQLAGPSNSVVGAGAGGNPALEFHPFWAFNQSSSATGASANVGTSGSAGMHEGAGLSPPLRFTPDSQLMTSPAEGDATGATRPQTMVDKLRDLHAPAASSSAQLGAPTPFMAASSSPFPTLQVPVQTDAQKLRQARDYVHRVISPAQHLYRPYPFTDGSSQAPVQIHAQKLRQARIARVEVDRPSATTAKRVAISRPRRGRSGTVHAASAAGGSASAPVGRWDKDKKNEQENEKRKEAEDESEEVNDRAEKEDTKKKVKGTERKQKHTKKDENRKASGSTSKFTTDERAKRKEKAKEQPTLSPPFRPSERRSQGIRVHSRRSVEARRFAPPWARLPPHESASASSNSNSSSDAAGSQMGSEDSDDGASSSSSSSSSAVSATKAKSKSKNEPGKSKKHRLISAAATRADDIPQHILNAKALELLVSLVDANGLLGSKIALMTSMAAGAAADAGTSGSGSAAASGPSVPETQPSSTSAPAVAWPRVWELQPPSSSGFGWGFAGLGEPSGGNAQGDADASICGGGGLRDDWSIMYDDMAGIRNSGNATPHANPTAANPGSSTRDPSATLANPAPTTDTNASASLALRFEDFEGRFAAVKEELVGIIERLQVLESKERLELEVLVKEKAATGHEELEKSAELARAELQPVQKGGEVGVDGDVQMDDAASGTREGANVSGAGSQDEKMPTETSLQTEGDISIPQPEEENNQSTATICAQEETPKQSNTRTSSMSISSSSSPRTEIQQITDNQSVSEADGSEMTSVNVAAKDDTSVDPRTQVMTSNLSMLVDNLVHAKMLSVMQGMAKGKARDLSTRSVVDTQLDDSILRQAGAAPQSAFPVANLLDELRAMKDEFREREQRDKEEKQAMRELHSAEVDALRRRLSYLENSQSSTVSVSGGRYRSSSSSLGESSHNHSHSHNHHISAPPGGDHFDGGRHGGYGHYRGGHHYSNADGHTQFSPENDVGGASGAKGPGHPMPTPTPSERTYSFKRRTSDREDEMPLPIKSQRKQHIMSFPRATLG